MEWQAYLDILHWAEKLKNCTRHCYTSAGRHESVAEHSWRLCVMAYFIRDRFPSVNMDEVMKMCLLHDMGESFTGDIPSFQKTDEDRQKEKEFLMGWVSNLPQPFCDELTDLFEKMEAQTTFEAKLYKALDKMEAVISHNESDIRTWLPLEYDLQLTYGAKEMSVCEELRQLKEAIDRETQSKIEKSKQAGYVREMCGEIAQASADGMGVVRLVLGDCFTNCYIVYERSSGLAMIIDPADCADKIVETVKAHCLKVRYIAVTHGHADHVLALETVRETFHVPVVVSKIDAWRLEDEALINERPYVTQKYRAVAADILVGEGDVLRLGGLNFRVMILPGHTEGSMALIGENAAFTGDVLLRRGHGKTSLKGGSQAEMHKSLSRLKELPESTVVYPGHKDITTIGEEINFDREKEQNILHTKS